MFLLTWQCARGPTSRRTGPSQASDGGPIMSVPFSALARSLHRPAAPDRRSSPESRRCRHRVPAVLIAPVTVVLGVVGAGAAVADSPDFTLTVGIPNAGSGAGEVENRSGTECCTQLLSEQGLGLPGASGARFGTSAVSNYDLTGD